MKLNKNNQVKDTLQSQERNFIRGIDFDMWNDRGIIQSAKIKDAAITSAKIGSAAITDANIGSLSFSILSGGTATLGGAANGDGLLLVKSAADAEVVRLDNAGILVNNGQIIVKNDSGGTVVDSAGIVSTVNFPNDQVFSNSGSSTSGTSYIDIPGSSLSPFVLNRATNVLITVTAGGYNNLYYNDSDNSMRVKCVDDVDGGLIEFPVRGNWVTTGLNVDFGAETASFGLSVTQEINTLTAFIPLTAGTHTLKLQFRVSGAGTATYDTFLLNYTILGG